MDQAKLAALIAAKKQAMKRVDRAAGFNPGKNRVRLLFGWKPTEREAFWRDFGQHFIKDAADQIQAVYVCTARTYQRNCSTCNALRALISSAPDDATSEILAKSRGSSDTLVNMLHLDSPEPNTPKVTRIGERLLGDILELITDHGWEAVMDPEKGHVMTVTRSGTGKNDTRYTASLMLDPGKSIPKAVLDKIVDLDDYVAQESAEAENRALAALNTVAGVLPAPSTPATHPSAIAAAPVAAIGRAAPARSVAAEPVTPDVTLDTELDDLLSDLPEEK